MLANKLFWVFLWVACYHKDLLLKAASNTNEVVQKQRGTTAAKVSYRGYNQNKKANVQAADASLVAGEVAKLRDALRQSQQHVDSLMGQAVSAASTEVTAQPVCLQCCHIPRCICCTKKLGMPG